MPVSKDPTYPLFPILSCIGIFLCIIPLPWHIQARNSGTCAFMLWTAAFSLVKFVGSVAWAGTVADLAPVWCDIATQIMLGATVGIPAASLCISRRLYKITTIRSVSVTASDKRRAVLEDVGIALGLPVLILILHIIVHPHRYDIYEDVGCVPVTYNTLPAYFLFFIWPVAISCVSFVYSALNLRTFYIRRLQFTNLIATRAAMSTSHYVRLMTLAFTDILFSIPIGSYVIYVGLHGVPLQPWISWAETHYDFGRIRQLPVLIWRNNPSLQISVELDRWLAVFCAFSFFALFGFANEAQKNYRLAFWFVAGKFGFLKPDTKVTKPSVPKYHPMSEDSLPMYCVSDKQPGKHTTDSDLLKTTVALNLSTGTSSSVLTTTPTSPPSSPPSYEWPPTPTTPSDTKHLSITTIDAMSCRQSTCSVLPSSPTSSTLPHHDTASSRSDENRRSAQVPRPAPVYIPDPRTDTHPVDPSLSPPFSPVPAYHRPLSPDVYPRSQPFGGF